MESARLKSLLESLIFVAESPLKISEMFKTLQHLERREAGEESEAEETEGELNDADELDENLQEIAEAQAKSESTDAAAQLATKVKEEAERLSKSDVQEALNEMAHDYETDPLRGIILVEVGGGWQFRTRTENAQAIRYLYQPKATRLSKPSLETMAIVAYRQPITRVEIDEIRGVDSGGVLKTLCEKNLVRIVGKKDEPGKPMLYGTTQEFLELFQLKGLKDLPTLRDYQDLEAEFRKQAGDEGIHTENESEEEAGEKLSLKDLVDENALPALDEEEEAILGALEDNIKEVRGLEKEIFTEETSEDNQS